MSDFHFTVNAREVAEKLGEVSDQLAHKINSGVESLSISTHAFVVNYANEKLEGWTRDHFFGEDNGNVRWTKAAHNIWVVEIDESVRWIEEGRPPTSMATEDWLLKEKPGSTGKVKTAKDGSKYRVIPFVHRRGGGKYADPRLGGTIRAALKDAKIDMKTIERDQQGNPKIGVIGKLDINKSRKRYPESFWSEPRKQEMADQIGLKSHHGHHFLKGAVVLQRDAGTAKKPKIVKEVVTYRVVSSKHKAEGRWMYPAVEPLNSIPEAYKYAEAKWEQMLKELEAEVQRGTT